MATKSRPIEAFAKELDLPLIAIPDHVLTTFARAPDTWEGLYRWLVAEHGATENPEPPYPSLQDRVIVGSELMERLLKVERGRLSSSRAGQALRDAVKRSNAKSGPRTQIRRERVSGDGCIVVPPEMADEMLSPAPAKRPAARQ